LPTGTQDAWSDHVLGPIVAFTFDTTLAVARMAYEGMFRDFPNVKWIVAHAGGAVPWLMERIDNGYRDLPEPENQLKIDVLPSTYLKGLYYDTVTFSPHALMLLRDLVGPTIWSWAVTSRICWVQSTARFRLSCRSRFRNARRHRS
jgi:predicted TIM-barrel fold metal-dependent hydrolase